MNSKFIKMQEDNDYAITFDPKVYVNIESYYCKIEGHMFVSSTLKSQHKIYSTGNKGEIPSCNSYDYTSPP